MTLQPLSGKTLWLASVFVLQACLAGPAAFAATSASQFGITWTFDRDYPAGQFANGDNWVVGPVKITSISPRSVLSGSDTINGSMINPAVNGSQGYDSRIKYNTFSSALNVGMSLPLTVQPGSSLISSQSYPSWATGDNPQLQTLAILTVLASPAPLGSFRPAPVGTDKTISWNKSQLNYAVLRSLPIVPNTPDLTTVTNYFARPWNEQVTTWISRYMHAGDNQPTYGREISHMLAQGLLSLQLNYTNAQKETLLIRLVQYGIDIYGSARLGGNWVAGGGHDQGRKMPMLLAGAVLGDANILSYGDGQKMNFQEDQQTWYVSQGDVGRALYTADGRERDPYAQAMVGTPEWGEQHLYDCTRDGSNWNAYYRDVAGCSTIGHVLAARLMGLQQAWNRPAVFDYYDRFFGIMSSQSSTGVNQIQPFVNSMWLAYRNGTPAVLNDTTVATSVWQNNSIAAQTGSFVLSFDMMASAANIDGVTGLSNGAATDFTSLATVVRFNTNGFIDARNGGAYQAAVAMPYLGGVTYHVVMSVNLPAKTYSVTVTPPGAAPVTIASNYQFRTEQAAVTVLNNVGFYALSGSHAVMNAAVQAVTSTGTGSTGSTTTTDTTTTGTTTTGTTGTGTTTAGTGSTTTSTMPVINLTSSGTMQNVTIPTITSTATLTFDTVPSASPIDAVTAVTCGAATDYNSFPVAVRFASNGMMDVISGTSWAKQTSLRYVAGTKYHVVITIDMTADSYSVVVTPAGGSPVTLSSGWGFYSRQASVPSLTNLAVIANSGRHTVTNVTLQGVPTTSTTGNTGSTTTTGTTGTSGTGTTTAPAMPVINLTSSGTMQNVTIPSITNKATLAFDTVPSASPIDAVTAVTCGAATSYNSFAVAVRFASNGMMDVISGTSWAKQSSLRYVGGTKYHVVITIDMTTDSYSVVVTPTGGSPVTLSSGWGFYSRQASVASLTNLAVIANSGRHSVTNVTLQTN